jgi:hypothetical protein
MRSLTATSRLSIRSQYTVYAFSIYRRPEQRAIPLYTALRDTVVCNHAGEGIDATCTPIARRKMGIGKEWPNTGGIDISDAGVTKHYNVQALQRLQKRGVKCRGLCGSAPRHIERVSGVHQGRRNMCGEWADMCRACISMSVACMEMRGE